MKWQRKSVREKGASVSSAERGKDCIICRRTYSLCHTVYTCRSSRAFIQSGIQIPCFFVYTHEHYHASCVPGLLTVFLYNCKYRQQFAGRTASEIDRDGTGGDVGWGGGLRWRQHSSSPQRFRSGLCEVFRCPHIFGQVAYTDAWETICEPGVPLRNTSVLYVVNNCSVSPALQCPNPPPPPAQQHTCWHHTMQVISKVVTRTALATRKMKCRRRPCAVYLHDEPRP